MDGFISWKTLWEWDDSGGKPTIFGITPNIWTLWEDQLLIRPLRIHRDLPIAGSQGHRVRDPKASAPSNALRSCSLERMVGSGCGSWSGTKENIGKTICQLGGHVSWTKRNWQMQVTWGKICLKKAPWKKKRLPPRTKTQFARNQLNAFIWGRHKTSIYTNTSIFIQYLSLQRGHMSLERAQTSLREYIYISLYIYICIKYHYILYNH